MRILKSDEMVRFGLLQVLVFTEKYIQKDIQTQNKYLLVEESYIRSLAFCGSKTWSLRKAKNLPIGLKM